MRQTHNRLFADLPKVALIEPSLDHASFFLELMNSEGYVKNIGDRGVRSLALAKDYLTHKIIAGRESVWGYRVIGYENQWVGIVGLLKRPNLPDPDLGFALLPRFEKKGIARAAGRLLLDEYFQETKNKIELPQQLSGITNTDNVPSQNILLSLGFSWDQRLPWNGDRVDYFRLRASDYDYTLQINQSKRCVRCYVDPCQCAVPPIINENIELLMISHCEELKRYSSTGRVAARALVRSYLIEQGRLQINDSYNSLASIEKVLEEKKDCHKIILSADSDSLPIKNFGVTETGPQKILLIAVDGSWRQASKLTRKLSLKYQLKKVGFEKLELTGHHEEVIRKEHFENGRSTLQAVGEAFYQLGEEETAHHLLAIYDKKLNEAKRRKLNLK